MSATKIEYAVLHFGFAESYKLASLVLQNQNEPYTSRETALLSVANSLLAMYKEAEGYNTQLKPCCVKNSGDRFCADCGLEIGKDDSVYAEDFKQWLLELLTGDLDSIGSLDEIEGVSWELGHPASTLLGLTSNEVVVVDEEAEEELCEILGLEE